jgi:hypothetical protein
VCQKGATRGGTHSLEDLLATDVLQPGVEVLDARGNVLELVLVGGLDLGRVADGEVEGEADAAVLGVLAEPAGAARGGRGGEAEHVVAGVGGGEGELAGGAAALGDDAVVVVEEFLGGERCQLYVRGEVRGGRGRRTSTVM